MFTEKDAIWAKCLQNECSLVEYLHKRMFIGQIFLHKDCSLQYEYKKKCAISVKFDFGGKCVLEKMFFGNKVYRKKLSLDKMLNC